MTFTQPSRRLSVQSSELPTAQERLRALGWFGDAAENGQLLERLERSWLSALVKSSPDLIGMVSFEGTWLFLNPVGQRELGWENSVPEPAIAADWMHWQQVVLPSVMQQEQWQGVFRFWHMKRDKAITLDSQWFLVRDPETNQPICLATVSRQASGICDEVAVVGESHRSTSEESSEQTKAELFATVVHELRAPLTVISSSAGLLETIGEQLESAKKQKHFQRIQAKVKQMAQLVEDLLLLARSGHSSVHLQPSWIDPHQVCAELIEEAKITSAQHQFVLQLSQIQQTAQVCVDELLLRRIVTNLLLNSIKYSPEGGTIYLDLVCSPRGLRLEIRDEGIGILPQDQPWLFESFYRASNVGKTAGTGLGLAIVKQCVDLHRGSITVQSQLGTGTTFVVELPNAE